MGAYRGDLTGVKAALQVGGRRGRRRDEALWEKEEEETQLVNLQNTLGWTACHAAAAGGHTKVLRYLISNAQANATTIPDSGGNYPIHQAAKNGHLHAVQVLEELAQADVTQLRLSHTKGNAVREYVLQAYRKKAQQEKLQQKLQRNNASSSDDDTEEEDAGAGAGESCRRDSSHDHEDTADDDDGGVLAGAPLVGYARKQAKSNAFFGPRRTPISCKIKKKIIKAKRKKKKEQQQLAQQQQHQQQQQQHLRFASSG